MADYEVLGSGTMAKVVKAHGGEVCGFCGSYTFSAGEEMIIVHKGNKPQCNNCAAAELAPLIAKKLKKEEKRRK